MVTLTGSPFKGNQLKAETGKIVHFWLLVGGEGRDGPGTPRGVPVGPPAGRNAQPRWRHPRAKSRVDLPQMLPPEGSI